MKSSVSPDRKVTVSCAWCTRQSGRSCEISSDARKHVFISHNMKTMYS